jgi:hypothetical protein
MTVGQTLFEHRATQHENGRMHTWTDKGKYICPPYSGHKNKFPFKYSEFFLLAPIYVSIIIVIQYKIMF